MTTATPTRPASQTDFVSWREFLTSPYAASLALVCLAVWLHAADSLIVATMMPSMVAEIGGAHLVGWNVSLYGTASLVAGAASALLTMRFGLRAPMSLAAVMFGLGCLLSALAPSMPVVLAGRLFQGLGGGGGGFHELRRRERHFSQPLYGARYRDGFDLLGHVGLFGAAGWQHLCRIRYLALGHGVFRFAGLWFGRLDCASWCCPSNH